MPAREQRGKQRKRCGREELPFQDGKDRSAQLAKHEAVIFARRKGAKV